jgi:HAD superfamily hydrolase (TIGR01509 family)
VTPAYTAPSTAELRKLLGSVQCLLLDFDGPVCRLFSGYPAEAIASMLRDHLAGHPVPVTDPQLTAGGDPHAILRACGRPELVAELEVLLTAAEEAAARSAEPTPLAGEFIEAAANSGLALAITTNNAPSAVGNYLEEHGLDGYFGSRIFGRNAEDPALMKPDPDCLRRAMTDVGARPEESLMIGDSAADAAAAKAAGVAFLGYARSTDRVARLQQFDPNPVVVGLRELVDAVRGLARPDE